MKTMKKSFVKSARLFALVASLVLTTPQSEAIVGLATGNVPLAVGGGVLLGVSVVVPGILAVNGGHKALGVWAAAQLLNSPISLLGLVLLPSAKGEHEIQLNPVDHSMGLMGYGVTIEDVAAYNQMLPQLSQEVAEYGEQLMKQQGKITEQELLDQRNAFISELPASAQKVIRALSELNRTREAQ